MRTIAKSFWGLLGVLLLTPLVIAQTPKDNAAPKLPDSPSKVLLDSWNDIGRKPIAMAEDMP